MFALFVFRCQFSWNSLQFDPSKGCDYGLLHHFRSPDCLKSEQNNVITGESTSWFKFTLSIWSGKIEIEIHKLTWVDKNTQKYESLRIVQPDMNGSEKITFVMNLGKKFNLKRSIFNSFSWFLGNDWNANFFVFRC